MEKLFTYYVENFSCFPTSVSSKAVQRFELQHQLGNLSFETFLIMKKPTSGISWISTFFTAGTKKGFNFLKATFALIQLRNTPLIARYMEI